jgi:hypothetical protein
MVLEIDGHRLVLASTSALLVRIVWHSEHGEWSRRGRGPVYKMDSPGRVWVGGSQSVFKTIQVFTACSETESIDRDNQQPCVC